MSDFADALQAVMDRRGYTISKLARAINDRGTKTTAATLSYWLSGQSKPRRRSSLEVLSVIEEILRQPSGSLMQLAGVSDTSWRLDRPRARRMVPVHPQIERIRGVWGLPDDDGLEREAFLARLQWRGNHVTFIYTMVSRATTDGVDRFLFASNRVEPTEQHTLDDPEVLRGAVIGRESREIPGVTLHEFLLPRPLLEGETFTVDVVRHGTAQPAGFTDFEVNTVRPIRVLSVQADFDEASAPKVVTRVTTRLGLEGSEETVRDQDPPVDGKAQATLVNVEMAKVRLEWNPPSA